MIFWFLWVQGEQGKVEGYQSIDPQAVAFLQQIQDKPLDPETTAFFDTLNKEKTLSAVLNTFPQAKKRCVIGKVEKEKEENVAPARNGVQLYIFMSFCIPPQVWQDLFKTAAQYPFTFVVRGLPQNSFKALGPVLEKIGCPVSINPDLFETYQIAQVPAFVFVQEGQYEGVLGNVSLPYVLVHLKEKGQGIAKRYAA